MACLPNHSRHRNPTICSFRIVVDVHVAVNNKKVFRVALEMSQWAPLPGFRGTKYFARLSKLSKCLGLPEKYPIFSTFNKIWSFSTGFRKPQPPISNFAKIRSVGAWLAHADGHTDR